MDEHIGEKHGVYTIIGLSENKAKDGHKMYVVQCECGEHKIALYSSISYNNTVYKCPHWSEYGNIKTKPNQIDDRRLAKIFRGMIRRCYVPEDTAYRFYGGKGIKVCQEWIDNPKSFEEWALDNGYKYNLTIDRRKSELDYCPENCSWVTRETNSRFKSNTNYITATVTLSGKQWAKLIPEIGENQINRILKSKGYDETVKYIEDKLKDKRLD